MHKGLCLVLVGCAAALLLSGDSIANSAIEAFDRQFLGLKRLHDTLSKAYSDKASPAMDALRADTHRRMLDAAVASYRWNRRQMEQRMGAELRICLDRMSAELSQLTKDFVADQRTKRAIEATQIVGYLMRQNETSGREFAARLGQEGFTLIELSWKRRMGAELTKMLEELKEDITLAF